MKPAGQIVAGDVRRLARSGDGDRFQAAVPVRLERPAVGGKSNTRQLSSETKTLPQLLRKAGELRRKSRQPAPRCLFRDQDNGRPLLSEIGRNREQQRACSGDDHPLSPVATISLCQRNSRYFSPLSASKTPASGWSTTLYPQSS